MSWPHSLLVDFVAAHTLGTRRVGFLMLIRYGAAATVSDMGGWLPLHYAVKQLAPEKTIEALLCQHPGRGLLAGAPGPGSQVRAPITNI